MSASSTSSLVRSQETASGRINEEAKQAWLDRMPNEDARAVAEVLLRDTEFISFADFSSALKESVAVAMETMDGRPYIVVSPYDSTAKTPRSETWVSGLAQAYITHEPVGYVGETELQQSLKEHPDISDVVLYDDASYSGQRVVAMIEEIALSSRLCGRAQPPAAHAIVPYMTNFAHDVITEVGVAQKIPVEIYASRRIETLAEKVAQDADPEKVKDTLRKHFDVDLNSTSAGGIGLTYFEHKLPDGHSFPAAVAEGRIIDNYGHLIAFSPFMPDITPPYKQRVG